MQKIKTEIVYPIFIPHIGCPFDCIYCNQYMISNTQNIEWDIILKNVKQFINKHNNQIKEIAFFGGSFTCLSRIEMQDIFDKFKDIMDNKTFFRISTRPDFINNDILCFLDNNKVSTIELGIQSFSDIELLKTKRGYDFKTAFNSCLLVKDRFNLCIQIMPGLPGFSKDNFLKTINEVIKISPEYLRIYPMIVLKDTELEQMMIQGRYTALCLEEALDLCVLFLWEIKDTEIKVIKIGLHSDVSKNYENIVDGPYHPNFGEIVKGLYLAKEIEEQAKSGDFKELKISDAACSCLKSNKSYALKYLQKNISSGIKIFVDKEQKNLYNLF